MKPKNIGTNFMGSVFGNSECETILANICLFQKKLNPEEFTPFTWDEYVAFRDATKRDKTQSVSDSERQILNTFVNGGRVLYTSASTSKGWLSFDESSERYAFTDKMIKMLEKDHRAA